MFCFTFHCLLFKHQFLNEGSNEESIELDNLQVIN